MAVSLLLLARRRATTPQFATAQSRYGEHTTGVQRWLSAGLSFGIAGGVGAALIAALAIPGLIEREPTVIRGTPIPMPTPDPIDERQPEPSVERGPTVITIPRPPIFVPTRDDPPIGTIETGDPVPPVPFDSGFGSGGFGTGGSGEAIRVIPTPAPILRDATRDPRFARSFQPAYPPALEREGVVGTARVRVRIGTDGRVISVENLDATDPAFFTATERQALRHWRFRPATRDGVPIESEQVLTVRFQVPDPD